MRAVKVKWMLLICLALASSQLDGGEQRPIDSQDLPGVPEGIRLGMSVNDLLKMRPKAEPFDLGAALGEKPPLRPLDLSKGSRLLVEEMPKGGLFSSAGYSFANGCCVGIVIAGTHAREEFIPKRTELLRQCVTLLGTNYEKHLISAHIKDASYLAPAFLWKGKERCFMLYVTPEYAGVTFEKGTLGIRVWQKGYNEPDFSKSENTDLLKSLFARLEKETAAAQAPKPPEGKSDDKAGVPPAPLSVLAARIEARIQRSSNRTLDKVRLGVLLHADRLQMANELFEALKTQRQEDEYAVLGHAKAQFLSGRAGEAFGLLQDLLVRYPKSPTILYELGMAHIRRDREGEGIALMKRVLEIDPFYARANLELAKWSAARSEPDKAIEYARRVLSAEDPGSPLAEKSLLLLDKLIPEKEP